MSAIALSVEVEFAGRIITCRELTVAEIRHWMLDDGKREDALADMLLEDVPFSYLTRASDVTTEELEAAHPSDIARFSEVVKEVNPHFFGFARRVKAFALAAMETA